MLLRQRLPALVPRSARFLNTRRRNYTGSLTANECEDFDIVIVGGGPAGLALTSALVASDAVRENSRIALVEAMDLSPVRDWVPEQDKFSNRVSSFTNVSRKFLQDIGVWEYVDETRTAPLEFMQVWDGISDARINFSPSDVGHAVTADGSYEMSRMTENINLQHALIRHLERYPQVSLMDKVKVSSIERPEVDGWPIVRVSDGRSLRARLLVGADGFNSPVRSFAQIESYGWAYDTHAIVATLFHASPLYSGNTTAYQRFLPTGPIAFLPLSSTASSLVWSTKPPLAAALRNVDPAVVGSLVNAAFRLPEVSIRHLHTVLLEAQERGSPMTTSEVLDEIRWRERSHSIDSRSPLYSSDPAISSIGVPPHGTENYPPLVTSVQTGTVASFPLRFSHADSYVGEGRGARTVLVGDAAHTVHPLAGQGLNMGLADAQALAECIHNAVLNGGDIGSYTSLIPYSRARYFENHKLLSATDKLHKLYSTTLPPLVWARSVGLEVVNEWGALKGALMSSAGARADTDNDSRASYWDMASKVVGSVMSGVDVTRGVTSLLGSLAKNSQRRSPV